MVDRRAAFHVWSKTSDSITRERTRRMRRIVMGRGLVTRSSLGLMMKVRTTKERRACPVSSRRKAVLR